MKKVCLLTLKCLFIFSLGLLITTSCEGNDESAGSTSSDRKNEDNTKYGRITLTLKGKRNDNVDFNETVEYKTTPSVSQNFYRVEESEGETTHYFYIQRNYKYSKKVTDGYMGLNLDVKNLGKATAIQYSSFTISASIAGDDSVLLPFYGKFEEGSTGVSNYKITDLTFNQSTKKLFCKFSFDVDGTNNNTGHPLSISGSIDVIVSENGVPLH